jgi:excinuclease ABC subunit C
VRRRTLLEHFGDIRAVQAATVDQIAALPGFSPSLAANIAGALDGAPPTSAD